MAAATLAGNVERRNVCHNCALPLDSHCDQQVVWILSSLCDVLSDKLPVSALLPCATPHVCAKTISRATPKIGELWPVDPKSNH